MESALKLRILTPSRHFFEGTITTLKTQDLKGPVDILPNYMTTIALLSSSFTEFTDTEGKCYKAFLSEGTLKVRQNSATIICRTAEWPEEIDVKRAEEAKERAELRLKNSREIDVKRAENSLLRAILRLRVINGNNEVDK